jgi:hypothetical protein
MPDRDAARFDPPLRSVLVIRRHQHTENACYHGRAKEASMFNIVEIRADGTEQIINSAPYRSEGEAWVDAHWIASAERQMGSTSTFTVRPA